MTKDTDGAVVLVGCIGLIPAAIFGYIIRAWAIVTLWGWFVVPYFHLEPPAYPVALGLSMLCHMLCGSSSAAASNVKFESATGAVASAYATILLHPVMSVSIGWMIHRWM